ncbi:hypothetical protein WJX79_001311 [Trebouxia sp. C0005]
MSLNCVIRSKALGQAKSKVQRQRQLCRLKVQIARCDAAVLQRQMGDDCTSIILEPSPNPLRHRWPLAPC